MDNVIECRERLFALWDVKYRKAVKKKEQNEEVRESARYILERNIICGNALSLRCVDEAGQGTDEPIIFSQWAFATGAMMKREDYTFKEMLHRGEPTTDEPEEEQIAMDFSSDSNTDDDEGTLIKVYPPIHYRRLKDYSMLSYQIRHADVSEYDCIGIASGIAYGKYYPQMLDYLSKKIPKGKPVFFIHTAGDPKEKHCADAKSITDSRGCPYWGVYFCKGYDTYGPWKLIGGINRNRPNLTCAKCTATVD